MNQDFKFKLIKAFDSVIFIILIILVFIPLYDIDYRYSWDPSSGKLGQIKDSGIAKNLIASWRNEYDTITVFGYSSKIGVVFILLFFQLFIWFRFKFSEMIAWVFYVLGAVLLVLDSWIYEEGFEHHLTKINYHWGAKIIFLLMAAGFLKEIVYREFIRKKR